MIIIFFYMNYVCNNFFNVLLFLIKICGWSINKIIKNGFMLLVLEEDGDDILKKNLDWIRFRL